MHSFLDSNTVRCAKAPVAHLIPLVGFFSLNFPRSDFRLIAEVHCEMKILNDNKWGVLTEATVAEFETRNRVKLPSDYRQFLLAHHGGISECSFYWVVANDWGSSIHYFLGFGDRQYLLQEYFDCRINMRIPADLLVVGGDGCLNYLAIGIKGDRYGEVFYTDCEYDLGEPERVRRIAKTFSQFLDELCAEPTY